MNMRFKRNLVAVMVVALQGLLLYGHDISVHRGITINAIQTANSNSVAYRGFFESVTSDVPYTGLFGATNAVILGSALEDNIDVTNDAGGKRSLNHFYDPLDTIFGKGLSDEPRDSRGVTGTNSFTWASVSNCLGYNFPGATWLSFGKNVNTSNIWSWQNARGYEMIGLTATNKSVRQANLLYMFRAVGQVMHLLEDASQPQHVRNEQHLDKWPNGWNTPWRSPIEDYGNNHSTNLNYAHSMLDWRSAGFTKLEDFWDRHIYQTNYSALSSAESGGAQLGLAEWCNGNFLGDRHTYGEYFSHSDIRYYPYPSLL